MVNDVAGAFPRFVERLGTDLDGWGTALTSLLGQDAIVTRVRRPREAVKAHGMTESVELEVVVAGDRARTAYLKSPAATMYAEDRTFDVAMEVAWRVEAYRLWPGHVRPAAWGRVQGNSLAPAEHAGETLCVLEWSMEQQPYAYRLMKLADLTVEVARADAGAICAAMLKGHEEITGADDAMWHRALRDGLVLPTYRLIDAAPDLWAGTGELRSLVEHAIADWRIELSVHSARLRRIHLDHHPWNVFLAPDGAVTTIGSRLPGMGDPLDDVVAFGINYLWASRLRHNALVEPYASAFLAFRDYFLANSTVPGPGLAAPFVVKRLLVLLNRTYYPDTAASTRRWLLDLLTACLHGDLDLMTAPIEQLVALDPALERREAVQP